MKPNRTIAWALTAATVGLAACSTLDVGQPPALDKNASWALLPMANYTETPDAGDRVASITESILHQKGGMDLKRYPIKDEKDTFILGNNAKLQQAAMDWASQNRIQYALTGSVQEWRYKTGVDGEPAVSVTFNLVDMTTGKTVWSATGSRTGWSRSSVGSVGQTLIDQLLIPIEYPPLSLDDRGKRYPGSQKARFSDALDGVTLYSRFFVKTAIRPVAVLEVVGYMGATIGVFYWINPQDPLLLMLTFPWIWLVATALALRYGALMGVLAGLMIVLAWEILYRGYQGNGALGFPVMFMSGGLVQVILAGHVRDVWSNLSVRANGINGYLNDHLASLTTAHYLLRVSHDRLERDLFTRPATLRSALEHMREITALSTASEEPHSPFKGAQAALDLISMICQLGSATLYSVASNGQVVDVSYAGVGTPIPLNQEDPVLKDCLARQSLSHLKAVDAEKLGSYYVAAPIVQVTGELIGVLLVHQIHFMALNHDNMQLMRVLLDYYGDGLAEYQLVGQVHRLMPQCPYGFAAEVERISHLKKLYDIESSLVALSFPRSGPGDLQFQQVIRQLRSLDMLWTDQNDERQFALFLMPLTEGDGVLGYMNRVEAGLKQTFQTTLAEAKIRFYSISVKARNAEMDLKTIYDQVRAP